MRAGDGEEHDLATEADKTSHVEQEVTQGHHMNRQCVQTWPNRHEQYVPAAASSTRIGS
jgi:hypothetical protein